MVNASSNLGSERDGQRSQTTANYASRGNRRCKYIDLLTIHKEGWTYLHATQTQSPLYSTEI